GLEVAIVAQRLQPGGAELRGDVFGRDVQPARRRAAPFQRVRGQEGQVPAHRVGGNRQKQLRLFGRQLRPVRLRGGSGEQGRQQRGAQGVPECRHRRSREWGCRSLASRERGGTRPQAFFTNSDFSPIWPMPSTLQSMSWSPSTRRMLRTLVPTLTTCEEPLIFRSLITTTLSPSA